jgi:hypothetical protein
MARQYLAEGLKGSFPFIADTKNIVVESLPDGRTRARIPGRLSICDCVNGNGRRYSRKVWEKNLQPGSALMQSITENAAWGLLEHPKDGQVTLNSPICIRTTAAKLQEGKDKDGKAVWEVVGEISILNPTLVPEAGRLLAMIQENYCPRVSSRGFGSLVKAADGVDDVQDDYICEGWDVVMKPSFESALLTPSPESVPAAEAIKGNTPTKPISETTQVVANGSPVAAQITTVVAPAGQPPVVTSTTPGVQVTLETERGSQAPTAGASAPAKSTTQPSQVKTMNLNEIKTQITSIRSLDPSKLDPQRFAEGMSQLSTLHQEVANFVAEDAKRSWQGTQLHDEIKAIENSWSETQLAPGKKLTKLHEDNSKLMQVIKTVAQTALTFKKKIGESIKQATRQAALLNEVTERGQQWRQYAKAMEAEATKNRRRFMMASEALQQFAGKYKKDITELGKAHLALEFKDKIDKPEFQALLKEATKPKALVPVRLALEGKITTDVAKSILEGKISLDETIKGLKGGPSTTPAKTDESKSAAVPPVAETTKPAASAAGTPTAPVSGGVTIVSQKPGDPRELTEAVGMVTRLSKATA